MIVLYYVSSYIVYQALMENYYDEKYYDRNCNVFAKFNELNNILFMLCLFIFMTIFDFSEYSVGYIVNDYLLSITLITLWILFIDKRKNIFNIYGEEDDIMFLKKKSGMKLKSKK